MARYRKILERAFEERSQKNSRYSMRALARDLNLSAQRLSGIMNGKFGLSRKAAQGVAERLGLDRVGVQEFCDSVESLHARSKTQRKLAISRLKAHRSEVHPLEEDRFRVVSDWYHFAILELTKVRPLFLEDTVLIAGALDLPVQVVQAAMTRLLKLGLLASKATGELYAVANFYVKPKEGVSEAIRKHHSQLLEKAAEAVVRQSPSERQILGLTLAVSAGEGKEIRRLMEKLQRTVQRIESSEEPKTAVYALTQQFFRLTQIDP